MKIKVKDPIIKKVVKKFVGRSNVGFKKYGVTLMDDPGDMSTWLNHLQEELMDAVNYLERVQEEVRRDKIEILRLKGEAEAKYCQSFWWYSDDEIVYTDLSSPTCTCGSLTANFCPMHSGDTTCCKDET